MTVGGKWATYSNRNALSRWRALVVLGVGHRHCTRFVGRKLVSTIRVGRVRAVGTIRNISQPIMGILLWRRVAGAGDHGIIIIQKATLYRSGLLMSWTGEGEDSCRWTQEYKKAGEIVEGCLLNVSDQVTSRDGGWWLSRGRRPSIPRYSPGGRGGGGWQKKASESEADAQRDARRLRRQGPSSSNSSSRWARRWRETSSSGRVVKAKGARQAGERWLRGQCKSQIKVDPNSTER